MTTPILSTDPIPANETNDPETQIKRAAAPAWLVSAAMHALIILVFAVVVTATMPGKDKEYAPMKMPPPAEAKKPITPPTDPVTDPRPQIDIPVETDKPSPITLEMTPPIDDPSPVEDPAMTETSPGDPTQVATTQMSDSKLTMGVIGVGSSAPGLFSAHPGPGGGHRGSGKPSGKKPPFDIWNGTQRTLRWFKRHQSPNGMWDAEHYQVNCQEAGAKCDPGSAANGGGSDVNMACTGYALQCFLAAGYDHKSPSQFREAVAKGLDWLLAAQKKDGLLGERNYEHAIATMALAEAYAVTNDARLKDPAQRAVNIILARQNVDGKATDKNYAGLGWDYRDQNATRNDSSVSGWNIMALKLALSAGLNVGQSLHGAKSYLQQAWKAANPDWAKLTDPYHSESGFPYTWDPSSGKVEIHKPGSDEFDMAPVGAMCASFLGARAGDAMLESLANHIVKYQTPAAYPCNTYYLYYSTMGLFQVGGDRWKNWREQVMPMVLKAQRGDGCFDGSWDWQNTKFHGNDVGRILSTAYCCLCLESFFAYDLTDDKQRVW